MGKRRRAIWLIAALAAVLPLLPGFDNRLTGRRYGVAAGLPAPMRLALITDFHSCRYGDGARELIEAVGAQAPDLVLLGGDIFDDGLPDDNARALLEGLSARYPCYYVTGNHEYWAGEEAFHAKMDIIEDCGVVNLGGRALRVPVGGATLTLCGLDDPRAFGRSATTGDAAWLARLDAMAAESEKSGGFRLLLTHRPEAFGDYADAGFDLVLAGHAHGGQWRVPGLVNGLFAPDQGLFPKYGGGRYESGGTVMIVSRGLARESTRVPRIYNPPELVVIELS